MFVCHGDVYFTVCLVFVVWLFQDVFCIMHSVKFSVIREQQNGRRGHKDKN